MDKHAIQAFSEKAHETLIESVTLRLRILGISENGVEGAASTSTADAEFYKNLDKPLTGRDISRRSAIVHRLRENSEVEGWNDSFNDLIEEVAYTWFNRLIALRFMEVNNYLPSGFRVLSSSNGHDEPDILYYASEAKDDLGGYSSSEKDLVENAWKTQDPQMMDRLYQMLFMKQIDALNEKVPGLFNRADDFMQLLFTPNYHNGIIKDLLDAIPEADLDLNNDDSQGQVQLVGWLYQFYNSDQKANTIKQPKSHKFRGTEIAYATQIFTPDWIARYMIQNSLGKLWIKHLLSLDDSYDEKTIAKKFNWKYYLADADQPDDVKKIIKTKDESLKSLEPKDIKILDPSMGSSHMLIYAFDLLMEIYLSVGFTRRQAALSIVQKNLFGLDIDKRATQLSNFSIMMKWRHYDRRAFDRGIVPSFYTVNKVKRLSNEEILLSFPEANPIEQKAVQNLIGLFQHSDVTGSLTNVDLNHDILIVQKLLESSEQSTIGSDTVSNELLQLVNICKVLKAKYEVVVTNPPYMGSSRMNSVLAKFAKKNYPNSKSDLFAMFLEHFQGSLVPGGYCAMVTMQSWMFLSSFESLRIKLLKKYTISSLMHMENNVMGIAFGTAVTITRNMIAPNFVGTYHQIKTEDVADGKIPCSVPISGNRYNRTNQTNFEYMPGKIFSYWISPKLSDIFQVCEPLSNQFDIKVGLQTGDNEKFYRQWSEVAFENKKWVKANKNGDYRKWYGNYDYVVNWQNDGYEIKHLTGSNGKQRSVVRNPDYYFKTGVSFSNITSSGNLSARYVPSGMIFDQTVPTIFTKTKEPICNVISYLNSKVANLVGQAVSPTMHFNVGEVSKYPYKIIGSSELIKIYAAENINIAKTDWDAFETSWDFKTHVLLCHIAEHHRNWTLEEAFKQWSDEAQQRFKKLKSNEEELNRIFIDLYGLQDELTPEVADKDISIRRADRERDIKSFLSYFIGVTFGRYSLDVPGLAFAGGTWDDSKYQTYKPNKDDIIVLTDEDYFGDNRDIIHRLKEFLTVTFGEVHLEENMRYIADSLGKRGETPEAQIRQYFLDDFYKKDHLSTYKKRPIYWELSSGRQNGFKALIYLHRYDDNTMAMTRTSYLHPLQDAYVAERERLQHMVDIEKNTAEKNQLRKRLEKVTKQFDEIVKYDAKLQHVANMHIAIDLDDGVVANHQKVQADEKLLAPLK